MADEKKHEHRGCEGCEAHRKAEREDLREKLKRCCEAREAARAEKEQEMQQAAEAHEEELKSLKKKLAAFQLATVVGVTILGQETFDKIMGKVDEAQGVTEKITGGGAAKSETEEKNAKPQPKSGKPLSWSGGGDDFVLVNNSSSGSWVIPFRRGTPQKSFDKPMTITEVAAPSLWEIANSTSGVQLPLPPKGEELTYTPPTPSTWSQYMFTIPSPEITPAVVALNTGVETVGDDAAFVFAPSASAVPTPNTFSVFALSLINNGRRRIA